LRVGYDRVVTYSDGSKLSSVDYYVSPIGAKGKPVVTPPPGAKTLAGAAGGSSPLLLVAAAAAIYFLVS